MGLTATLTAVSCGVSGYTFRDGDAQGAGGTGEAGMSSLAGGAGMSGGGTGSLLGGANGLGGGPGSCPSGFTSCDGTPGCRVNLATDPVNCGRCYVTCGIQTKNAAGTLCYLGKCDYTACGAGFADCDGDRSNGCEADLSKNGNCGGCGVTCATPAGTLSNGCEASGGGFACKAVCDSSHQACADAHKGCSDVTLDPMNCGACGTNCTNTVVNANATCAAKVCGYSTCLGGFSDCDNNRANGCELSTSADKANCGGCGRACNGANGAPSCVGSKCTMGSCATGYQDCSADENAALDGCETHVAADPAHCGNCTRVCSGATPFCANGACAAALPIALASGTFSKAGGNGLTFNYPLQTPRASNPYRMLLLGLATRGNAATNPGTITVGGKAMTLAGSGWSGNQAWAGIYYLPEASLPATAGDLAVFIPPDTTTTPSGMGVNIVELLNVDPSATPVVETKNLVGNTGGYSSLTLASVPNGFVYSALANFGGATFTPVTLTRTTVADVAVSGVQAAFGYALPTGTSQISNWSLGTTSGNFIQVVVSLKPVTTP